MTADHDTICERWRSETGLDALLRHAVEEATATLRRERDEAREAVKRRIELHVSECASLDDLVRHIANERDEARALVGRLADALEWALRYAEDNEPERPPHVCSPMATPCDGVCADWGWFRKDFDKAKQALASIPPSLRRPAGEPA